MRTETNEDPQHVSGHTSDSKNRMLARQVIDTAFYNKNSDSGTGIIITKKITLSLSEVGNPVLPCKNGAVVSTPPHWRLTPGARW
jgi:hypothetical protein